MSPISGAAAAALPHLPPSLDLADSPPDVAPRRGGIGEDPQDERFADPSALLAQAVPQRAGFQPSGPFRDPVALVGHLASPDAIVVTLGAANLPGQRHFALANPLLGSATHFISHKNDKVTLGGLPFNRVETVHYGIGQATRREDGLGWSMPLSALGVPGDAGRVVMFANMRAGDTNLLRSDHGASVNVGFFGPPAALAGAAERLADAGNPRVAAVGEALGRGMRLAGAAGSEFGLAWRGTLTLDQRSGELMLNLSGRRIPLADFSEAMSGLASLNRGSSAVARANNREDYLAGANPYALADYTRTPQGALRNHGDPVSAIAGGIVELGRSLLPGSPPVRTNAQARSVLEMAIARDIPPLTPEQRGLWHGRVGDSPPAERVHPLNDGQRRLLDATLRQLERYDLDFGSARIREAARAAGGTSPAPLDRQFVRDVFEGDFRVPAAGGGNHLLFDLAVGASRHLGIFAGVLNAGPTARDDMMLQQTRARAEGLEARLDAHHGGVLRALSIDTQGLDARARASLPNRAVDTLALTLESRLAARGEREPGAQALYREFQSLSAAERAAIGARIGAALR